MKNVLKYLLLALIAVSQLFACGGSDDEKTPADNFDVQFTVPGSVDVTEGGECTFAVSGGGKSPLTTDTFILESDAGISYVCPIVNTSSDSFTVRLADGCETGYYKVFVKRDARKKSFGRIYINIVEDIDFKPDAGTTVYGIVSSAGVGVENVVVSDGAEVTVTNEKGIYQLKSAKKWGYVFISVPSGYEVPSVGVLPQFHRALKNSADVVERADFKLEKVDGQDSYKIFMLGDMHLANRTGDLGQFAQFTSDLTDYMTRHKGEKMYALTLGDMTWDLYWYSNSYYFPQYLNTVNSQIKNLQIFHTMGNHDNDFQTRSDYDAAVKYVDQICPTYYSFNIGKVHYVVMDDIDCSSYDGSTSRNYVKSLSAEQLDWLAKDLSYVAKTTPVVVAMHAQVFYPTTSGFKIDHDQVNTLRLFDILDGYTVRFVTGHTHKLFNVTPDAPIVDGHNFREYNSGSVCASWWWSGNLTPGIHIGTDGTPGGYGIWDVTGTDFQCLYKSTGWPEEYQFRSYDLNNVHFSMADVPLMHLRFGQERLYAICQRLSAEQRQRGADQHLELEFGLDVERRRRKPQDAALHRSLGLRPAPYRGALGQAVQQRGTQVDPVVHHRQVHALLQGEGGRCGHRPCDHRQGRIRKRVDRKHAAAESILHGCLPTQVIFATYPTTIIIY